MGYGGYLAHQYFQQDPYYQQGYAPQQAVYYQPNLDYPAQEVGVQARIPARVQSTNPDGRFFGLLSSINFVPTVTSSIFATVTSTGTVGSVQSCIDVGDFAAGLTTACRRRRRADMELLDTLNIQTSEIETIKTSAVSQLTKREVEPVIVSSFESRQMMKFLEKKEKADCSARHSCLPCSPPSRHGPSPPPQRKPLPNLLKKPVC